MADSPFSEFGAGDVVFKEGDRGDTMFIIESGNVELLRGGLRGEVLMKLGPGDFFGEMEVVQAAPRFLTAIARTRSRVLRVEADAFRGMVEKNTDIALRIIQRMAERVRESQLRSEQVQSLQASPAVKPAASATRRRNSPAGGVVSPTPLPKSAKSKLPRAATLVLLHEASGKHFSLPAAPGDILVGRTDAATGVNAGVDLSALDEQRTLSRRHAWLVFDNDAWGLREEPAAANGSFVNDERLSGAQTQALKEGDRVRFGLVELKVTFNSNNEASQ